MFLNGKIHHGSGSFRWGFPHGDPQQKRPGCVCFFPVQKNRNGLV